MSILQEYESIRSRLKPGESEAIENYLGLHPELFISDIYYREEVYCDFAKWWESSKVIEPNLDSVEIYVDGSYSKDTDLTGSGIVIKANGIIYKKSFVVPTEDDHSWNIDGECHAVLESLKICGGESGIENKTINSRNITINYDYLGIEKWATGEWKAKSKIAKLYAEEFKKLINKYNFSVTFNKVKAHSGDQYNDIADGLAKEVVVKK